MIQIATVGKAIPVAHPLDADICVLMCVKPHVTIAMTKVVQLYVREVLNARAFMLPTTEIHRKFLNTMEAFGGLDGPEPRVDHPYLITARGAPQDWTVKGTSRTLLQMTVEKYASVKLQKILAAHEGPHIKDGAALDIFNDFRNVLKVARLDCTCDLVDTAPHTMTIEFSVRLPGYTKRHVFELIVGENKLVTISTNGYGYEGAYTQNKGWLPTY